jgi:hypothetical protein
MPEITDLKIQINKTEVVKAEKTIEMKPAKDIKKASPPADDEVITEKTVE